MLATPYWIHTSLEIAAYSVGFQWYLRARRRAALSPVSAAVDPPRGDAAVAVIAGAIMGAALGGKIAYWLYDPAFAFADFPDSRHLLAGKSIIGGLLGGLAGVELGKRLGGVRQSTGDAMVTPLMIGIVIGRVGCFLAGLDDHTYGNPTSLPWAVDFGDGVPRHPTQLYEIVFLLASGALLHARRDAFERSGDRFRAFMIGYLAYRLLVEAIRPIPFHYLGLVSGLQLLCLAGLLYYRRDIFRIARTLAWARS